MARRRSRAQRSISLEMLIGIVIALMVLSFLAGFFLGSRRAVGAAAEARAVELTAAAADADAGKEAAEKEASEKEAEEKEAAEKGAGETEAAPVEARSDGNGVSAAAEEPSAEVSVETTAAGTPEAAAGEAAPAESGAVTTTAAPAETRALATTAAPAETRALATTAASAETRAVSAGRDAGTGAGEAVAAETSAAVSAQSTGTQVAGRAIAGNPEPDEAPTYLDNVIKDSPLVGVAAGTVYSASDIDTGDPGKYTQILSIEEGDYVYNRISGRSWQKSNEVALSDLRYVKVLHYNDEGKIQVGEMIVHKDILEDVTDVFTELFRKKYAVGSMHLIDDYFAVGGAEAAEAFCADRNNSTAFCSGVKASDGTPRAEAYGKAVLLNPGKRSADDAAEAVFSSYGFTKNGVRYEKR